MAYNTDSRESLGNAGGEKPDKRIAIMEAAVSVVCQVGLDGLSMAEVADRAGVAKGTLYLYFTTKDQLIQDAFWYCHEENVAACDSGLDQISGALPKLLQRLRNAVKWALRNLEKGQFERMCLAKAQFGATSRYQNQHMQFKAVDHIIRDGLEAGELRLLPSPVLGEMFFGIGGAVLYYLLSNPEALEDKAFWHQVDAGITGCLGRLPE